MEPNEEYRKDRRKDCFCLWLIVAIVAIVLSFFIGVLVAGLTAILTILGIGGIVTLVIALVVILIIAIINAICCKKNDKKKHCC